MSDEKKDKNVLNSILEYGGALIILGIVILFIIIAFIRVCKHDDSKTYVDTLHISKIDYFEIPIKKKDTGLIVMDRKIIKELKSTTDSINSKIKEINKASIEANKIQKENSEDYRLYLTIIGSIFAIVGFFGFKSIHDTRQTAIESVKIKAEEVAKKVTDEKIKDYLREHVESEIKDYFKDKGDEIIKKHSKEISEETAYLHATTTAEKATTEQFNILKAGYEESKKALRQDLAAIERDRKTLLKRIQDLERFFYGDPNNEDGDSSNGYENGSDNETPVV